MPYLDRMDLAYAAADAVVCRSGANTVCELTAVGLPAVYVPLPIGNGEQRLNAAGVVAAGGGLLVEDADVDPGWVAREVVPLLQDRGSFRTDYTGTTLREHLGLPPVATTTDPTEAAVSAPGAPVTTSWMRSRTAGTGACGFSFEDSLNGARPGTATGGLPAA